jgi:hypothetical protein
MKMIAGDGAFTRSALVAERKVLEVFSVLEDVVTVVAPRQPCRCHGALAHVAKDVTASVGARRRDRAPARRAVSPGGAPVL